MGHGNCIVILEKETRPFLIDCGTNDQLKCTNITHYVKPLLDKIELKDLAVTHYHFDHYNLLDLFSYKYFNNIYLPALPQQSSTGNVMLDFLSLAIVAQYKGYPLIPLIISRGQYIYPYDRGDSFDASGRHWEVLWPDFNIIDTRNIRNIEAIRSKINEVKETLSENQLREFNKFYDYLSRSFSRESKEPENFFKEIEEKKCIDNKVQESLESVEHIFKTLANRSSLVIRDIESSDFLFTGDIDNTILDHYLSFGNHHYFLVETPHHGGYFGQAFNNVTMEFLVISRENSYKPRCEYLRDLSWTNIVDTARIGNCIIRY